jgi:hypothetical protein
MESSEQGRAGIPPDEEPEREDRAEAERQVAEERERATGPEPHHELSNPAEGADPTEFPDPYERRSDPRDPATVDTPADPADPEEAAERDDPPQDPSTSDPPPPRNLDRLREGEGEEA